MTHLLQDSVKQLKSIIIRGTALSCGQKTKIQRWQKQSMPNALWLDLQSQGKFVRLLSGDEGLNLMTPANVCASMVQEARVMALPVVASLHGVHTQYIQHDQNDFICSFGFAESWKEALLQTFLKLEAALAMDKFMAGEHRRLLKPERTEEGFLCLYGQGLSIFRP